MFSSFPLLTVQIVIRASRKGTFVCENNLDFERFCFAMASEGSNGFVQPSIPKFDGDYDHWSMLMENFLRSKEYWSLIENEILEPGEGETMTVAQKKVLEDLKLKDLNVKNYMFQSIHKSILKTILQRDTSRQIWESMRKKYQGNAKEQRAQLQALRRDFEIPEMKFGEFVSDYFVRVMLIANNMRNHGESMPDVKIVEKILRSLTDQYNFIVCSIEESRDIESLTVDELQSSLVVHEQKFRKKDVEEHALKISSEERLTTRGRGRNYSRWRSRGKGRLNQNRATVECYKCHKLGHF